MGQGSFPHGADGEIPPGWGKVLPSPSSDVDSATRNPWGHLSCWRWMGGTGQVPAPARQQPLKECKTYLLGKKWKERRKKERERRKKERKKEKREIVHDHGQRMQRGLMNAKNAPWQRQQCRVSVLTWLRAGSFAQTSSDISRCAALIKHEVFFPFLRKGNERQGLALTTPAYLQ